MINNKCNKKKYRTKENETGKCIKTLTFLMDMSLEPPPLSCIYIKYTVSRMRTALKVNYYFKVETIYDNPR